MILVSVKDQSISSVDQALRQLIKKGQREGIFKEFKKRRHYEKPSEKAARKKEESERRRRKAQRRKPG